MRHQTLGRATAPGALSVYVATRYPRAPGCEASHLQAEHGELVRIVSHSQLGEKDISEVRDVDYVAERLRWRRDLNRFAVRSFYAHVFDLDMFYQ